MSSFFSRSVSSSIRAFVPDRSGALGHGRPDERLMHGPYPVHGCGNGGFILQRLVRGLDEPVRDALHRGKDDHPHGKTVFPDDVRDLHQGGRILQRGSAEFHDSNAHKSSMIVHGAFTTSSPVPVHGPRRPRVTRSGSISDRTRGGRAPHIAIRSPRMTRPPRSPSSPSA